MDLQLKTKPTWSHMFPASLLFSSGNKQKLHGAKSGLYLGWDNNCHLKVWISSIVDEAV